MLFSELPLRRPRPQRSSNDPIWQKSLNFPPRRTIVPIWIRDEEDGGMDLKDAEIAAASLPSIGLAIRMTETKSTIEVAEGGIATRKRRSKRIHIAMPVIVRATNGDRPIEEATKTLRVNAHGCLLYLATNVQMGR